MLPGRTRAPNQRCPFYLYEVPVYKSKTIRLYMWNYVLLQTILLGDSGVGKTSLLVQFDTGKFQTGTFSATVGIGFTVSW